MQVFAFYSFFPILKCSLLITSFAWTDLKQPAWTITQTGYMKLLIKNINKKIPHRLCQLLTLTAAWSAAAKSTVSQGVKVCGSAAYTLVTCMFQLLMRFLFFLCWFWWMKEISDSCSETAIWATSSWHRERHVISETLQIQCLFRLTWCIWICRVEAFSQRDQHSLI